MKIHYIIIASLIGFLLLSPLQAQDAEKMPNNEGIVVSMIDTTGYTYIELENNGKSFWIAAPTTKVEAGDHIRFVESMAMNNFTSKTLDRTFHRLIFVSSTMVKK